MLKRIIYSFPLVARWLIFFIYLLAIVYASLASPSHIPKLFSFPHIDKVVHFAMYFGFCLLALWSLDTNSDDASRYRTKSLNIFIKYPIALLMAFSWGLIMEFFQRIMNIGRHFSMYDLLANIIGAVAGALIYYILLQQKSVRNTMP